MASVTIAEITCRGCGWPATLDEETKLCEPCSNTPGRATKLIEKEAERGAGGWRFPWKVAALLLVVVSVGLLIAKWIA